MSEVSTYGVRNAIMNLGDAFKRFFKKQSRYPRFKKKGRRDSFRLDNGVNRDHFNAADVILREILIPKLGWVRMREFLRFEGQILKATISRTADKWFVSIVVDTDQIKPTVSKNQATVGVDLGINTFAFLSNEETFQTPKPLKQSLKKLARLQKSLSRKKKGSRNREKARMKVARLHYRISCIRTDFLHKLTSYLSRNFSKIVIEDLHVKGMVKNHKLARSLSDVGFGEFRRQLEYKCKWYGTELVIANRWFPSSKKCWWCGEKRTDLTLGDRTFICEHCGWKADRDLNAAMNLKDYTLPGNSRDFKPVEIT